MSIEFWTALGAIATLAYALITLVTGLFVIWQLLELRRATSAATFTTVLDRLQNPAIREARYRLLAIQKPRFEDWTEEEIQTASLVCQAFDSVGMMVTHRFIPRQIVVQEWSYNIVACWEAAQPMIEAERKIRGKEFWDDFENLYYATRVYYTGLAKRKVSSDV